MSEVSFVIVGALALAVIVAAGAVRRRGVGSDRVIGALALAVAALCVTILVVYATG